MATLFVMLVSGCTSTRTRILSVHEFLDRYGAGGDVFVVVEGPILSQPTNAIVMIGDGSESIPVLHPGLAVPAAGGRVARVICASGPAMLLRVPGGTRAGVLAMSLSTAQVTPPPR